jgi:inosine-uridine nucleoside N-ribohydrolase
MLKHIAIAAIAGMFWAVPAGAAEKIILDTDFTTIGDDGKVAVMAAQLHAAHTIELLGITVVAGNGWLNQEVSDALRAVERLGLADSVGVYAGARYPLVHDYATMAEEKALWGVGGSWYRRAEPADSEIVAPLDGFAKTTHLQKQHAVNFIIDTVKKYPHEVSLLVIGPMTNIALAIRMNPEIVPLIKRIVFMAGAFEVPGNTTPAAEMNVWYDAEAARAVVRQPIEKAFIPLDVTNTVAMDGSIFQQITRGDSIVAQLLKNSPFAKTVQDNPKATSYIYDTLALTYLLDSSYATDVADMWVDVDTSWGPTYGKTIGYRAAQTPAAGYLQKCKVVLRFDNQRFFKLFVDLLTRPVPVRSTN